MKEDLLKNWEKKSGERQKEYKKFLNRANKNRVLKQLPDLNEEAFGKVDRTNQIIFNLSLVQLFRVYLFVGKIPEELKSVWSNKINICKFCNLGKFMYRQFFGSSCIDFFLEDV